MNTPFPWQIEDALTLTRNRRWFLANEMRTGKTGSALLGAAGVGAKRVGVVCPAIVTREWFRQFEDFGLASVIPELRVTSYDMVGRHGIAKCLGPIDALILDEAHYLKTPDAKRTEAIYLEPSVMATPYVWQLSGTPAPNHAGEYWTHLSFAGLTNLSYWSFLSRYCIVEFTPYGHRVTGNRKETLPELRGLLSRFMSRRTQASVWKETPAPFWSVRSMTPTAKDAETLALLDQKFNGAAHVGGEYAELGALARERRELGMLKVPYVMDHTHDLLKQAQVPKVLLGVWHLDVLDTFEAKLRAFDPITIRGGVADKTRWALKERFQTAPQCRVAIVQMKAGGTGISLSAAAHVVLAEPDWGRDVNEQFVQRPQHIERTVPLPVDLMVMEGSLDETIIRANQRKVRMNNEISAPQEQQVEPDTLDMLLYGPPPTVIDIGDL